MRLKIQVFPIKDLIKIKLGDVKMSYDILTIALILYCAVMFVFAILYLND